MSASLDRLDEARLRALLRAGRTLTSNLDLEAVLAQLLTIASELTGARYAAMGVLDETGRELERFLTHGLDRDAALRDIGELPRGRGVLGLLIDEPAPLRLEDVGGHPRSYGFPPGHPPMRTFLGVPVRVRGTVFGNLYLTEKEGGGPFDDADEGAVVLLAEWAAIAIANARLYRDESRRRDELERAVRALEATSAVARAVGGETDLARILELIVKRARALVDARAVVIWLTDAEGLVAVASAGELPARLEGRRLTDDGGAIGEVLRTGVPERVTDAAPRLRMPAVEFGFEPTSALLMPLVFRGQPLGVLGAFDRRGPDPLFGEEQERLMTAFAASAATAVATGRSVAATRLRAAERAAEDERRRWARELHDQTLQGLGAAKLALTAAGRADDAGRLREALARVDELLGAEIDALHGLITELRPAALDEIGLRAALEGLAGRVRDRGLDVALTVEAADDALPPELATTVYRLVQEALTNAVKHARASGAEVRVRAGGRHVEVEVRDDGRGFEAGAAHEGFGLVGMHERVALADGVLDLRSAPGEGTTVRARLPLGGERQALAG